MADTKAEHDHERPMSTTPPDHRSAPFDLSEPALLNAPSEAPKGSRWLRWALIASDITAVTIAWVIVNVSGLPRSFVPMWSRSRLGFLPVIVLITIAMIFTNKLYRTRQCSVRAVETAGLMRACGAAGVGAWLIAGRYQAAEMRIRTIVVGMVLALVFIVTGRALYRSALRRARRDGRFTRPVVIVGTGDEAYELQRLLVDEPELGYTVVGVVGRAQEAWERNFSVPYLGASVDTASIVRRHGVSGVIIGSSSLSFRELNDVVRTLLDADIHVQVSGGLLGFDSSRLRANPIGREAAFYLEQAQLSGWQSKIKRGLDLSLGAIALVLSAPIVGALALLVRRDGGPAIFRQTRVGLDGKPFTVLKLRTMVVDAEARLTEVMSQNERTGPLFKMGNDPRFTRLGRFMDATSLNELPQLWNVLRGQMSLVGPRPALEHEVANFTDRLLLRHRVKPGITGLWQVESRDAPSFADYERCDVFYVENWSVRLDVMIIFQTLIEVGRRSVVLLRGAVPVANSGGVAGTGVAASGVSVPGSVVPPATVPAAVVPGAKLRHGRNRRNRREVAASLPSLRAGAVPAVPRGVEPSAVGSVAPDATSSPENRQSA